LADVFVEAHQRTFRLPERFCLAARKQQMLSANIHQVKFPGRLSFNNSDASRYVCVGIVHTSAAANSAVRS